MELRQLRYFCAVGAERHVTRAALKLRVAQSAVTKQLRLLEDELRVQLLRRSGRGIALTEAGEAFLRDANAVLGDVQQAARRAREVAQGERGPVSVGLTDSAGFAGRVTVFLERARATWPNVRFNLREARSIELLDGVAEGQLDLAFVRAPGRHPERLESIVFLEEPYLAVIPLAHPLAARPAIGLAALAAQPLILPASREGAADEDSDIVAALRAGGGAPVFVQRTPSYVTAINLAAAGFGLTIAPSVLRGLRGEAVAYRPLLGAADLSSRLLLVQQRERPRAVVRRLFQLASEMAAGAA